MAVNEIGLTVVGWAGNEPTLYLREDGQVPFAKFRLASTPRVYDRAQDAFVDGPTSWFTVKAFRALAQNITASIRRGDPLVVHGRVRLVDWVTPDGHTRTTAELTAESVGHDLTRGTTRFMRTVHEGRPADASAPGQGGPGGPGGGPGSPGSPGAVVAGQTELLHVAGPVDLSGALVLPDDPEDRADAGETAA